MDKLKNYNRLKKLAFQKGAVLFGVADSNRIKSRVHLENELIKKLPYAISLSVKVSSTVLEEIETHPTKLYFHHYRALNQMLDQIALLLVSFMEQKGFNALPIPASQIIDWEKQFGACSHKEIAHLAGLGWIGRNNLLVNKKFGSQIRLASIFTDMPLKADKPSADSCGKCFRCAESCPVDAIKEDKKDFWHIGCFEKLKEFRDKKFTDQFICGICVKACRGDKGYFIEK
jgi:epoxyqueuosine reductase QueG